MREKSSWEMYIGILRACNDESDKDKAKREFVYDMVRDESGFDFADYGDDPKRWIEWLEADDTSEPMETDNRYVTLGERYRENIAEQQG